MVSRRERRGAGAFDNEMIVLCQLAHGMGDCLERRYDHAVQCSLQQRPAKFENCRYTDACDEWRRGDRHFDGATRRQSGIIGCRRRGFACVNLRFGTPERACERDSHGQPAAAKRHENCIDIRQIFKDFSADSRVSHDDIATRARVHERSAFPGRRFTAEDFPPRFRADADDFRSHVAQHVQFAFGGGLRHIDPDVGRARTCRTRHTQREISRARRIDAFGKFRCRETENCIE